MEETWKDIVGYEGAYQISNLGRIKTLPRILIRRNGSPQTIKPKIRKNTLGNNGYYTLTLQVDGKKIRTEYIHQLLAKTFIPNPENHPNVCHKNDIKTDNRLENLYWGTRKDNAEDSVRNGRHVNTGAVLTIEKVREIRTLLAEGFTHGELSRRFHVGITAISNIKLGKTWTTI
jgi:hypothetical protein